MNSHDQQIRIKILRRHEENEKILASQRQECVILQLEVKSRLDDALRRLNTAADDLKEIRRILKSG